MKLIHDKNHQTYYWQLEKQKSSPSFSAESQAIDWYDQLQKYFFHKTVNKPKLPKLLTKF